LKNKTKITVVGCGYVGMSISVLLSQDNDVIVLDTDKKRINEINNRKSTVKDHDIEKFLQNKNLSLHGTLNKETAYKDSEFIIIATPTNYDPTSNFFDTSSVDGVVRDINSNNKNALIVIKSTIPIGYTDSLKKKYNTDRIIFSPEFLEEGSALKDNLYPSRIIIGGSAEKSSNFAALLVNSASKKDIEVLHIGSKEAEAIKLFSNTYLAMRVSFFNELDSYALDRNLNTKEIINGVCLDDRIGKKYKNPSFGYGGYCLPKDTKQLLSNFEKTPQSLISAIVSSNDLRKSFIASKIVEKKPNVVGIYRLVMKKNSDNFRSSAVLGLLEKISDANIEIIIYEPLMKKSKYDNFEVISCLDKFKELSDIIICNRLDDELQDVLHKLFTRDVFGEG
jgi:UDPglucose 6-dehydrogenase